MSTIDPTNPGAVASGIAAALNSIVGRELWHAKAHDSKSCANWFINRGADREYDNVCSGYIRKDRLFIRVEPPQGKKPGCRVYLILPPCDGTEITSHRKGTVPVGLSKAGTVRAQPLHDKIEAHIKAMASAVAAHQAMTDAKGRQQEVLAEVLKLWKGEQTPYGSRYRYRLDNGIELNLHVDTNGIVLGGLCFPGFRRRLDGKGLITVLEELDELVRRVDELQAVPEVSGEDAR